MSVVASSDPRSYLVGKSGFFPCAMRASCHVVEFSRTRHPSLVQSVGKSSRPSTSKSHGREWRPYC